jgi:hypothetical protein
MASKTVGANSPDVLRAKLCAMDAAIFMPWSIPAMGFSLAVPG